MNASRWLGIGALALVAASACRPREGDRCICAGECAGGLVCAADGAILRDNQCVSAVSNDLESGICVDAGDVDLTDDALTPPPKFDAGSWATSGEVPVTTAATTTAGDATTMPDDSSSTSESADASSGTEGDATSTGMDPGTSSSSGGEASSESTAGM